ncbi:histidine phosphatase family protein [Limosilactobacillus fastidiosus]|uniref:Histidine phosphatase family protein n=1 Tax=Limosilactobacillus fastidiosus TaxID=2759855 RepID=A0A7W3TY84_9LACO|nr:histidine phosphatase family protein [Limosilactobacillus fastidiosus]MBB1062344.1 histidine phosphatase family protein [Limosilactobacillus fastidiosus]MBB1085255.1 histidine phosphatase family protein [Limosilactobacillus fastidiosus]MCD7083420.1 histidine phosphatase family protein [Limosilactobacillus fastidiosus]MCD7085240.1 histidine phosphatase family protein [Limosilactobacillus fastidiosus]MCD7115183.1 histidine phosphatase family protein [Limosilactobacillus fastidiosus]
MTKVYLIRHGKTQWNLESRYQGANGDSPLLDQSYEEIEMLAASLNNVPINHIYTSPLKRARVTAMTLLQYLNRPVPLTIDSRLKEFNLGKMEGMHFDAVAKKWPEVLKNFRHHPDKYDSTIVESESFEQVINRMGTAIREFCRNDPHGSILIVSHGAALNASINALIGTPMAHLKDRGGLSNTSTTILTTDDAENFELEKWNDTSYLHKTSVDPTDTI